MLFSDSTRIKIFIWWLVWVWFWRNPFHKWGTVGQAIGDRYCATLLAREGQISPAALDILDERIQRFERHTRRVNLLRVILLPVLVLSTMGIVVHVDIHGAQLDLNNKLREVLLLLTVTLSVYLSYTSFVSSSLYSCLKAGSKQANLPKSATYKYLSSSDLFMDFIFAKEETVSLSYAMNVLVLLLFYLVHLIVFLFLDVAAYLYVAFDVRAHPAFGNLSLAIANYAIFATATVFFFTMIFNFVRFRYYRAEYKHKLKNSARYLKLFLHTAAVRRIRAGFL